MSGSDLSNITDCQDFFPNNLYLPLVYQLLDIDYTSIMSPIEIKLCFAKLSCEYTFHKIRDTLEKVNQSSPTMYNNPVKQLWPCLQCHDIGHRNLVKCRLMPSILKKSVDIPKTYMQNLS